MFLLCQEGSDWGTWSALSAGDDKAAMQLKADELNAADNDRGYKKFYVQEISSWPSIGEIIDF